jgi:hypothetical protein
MFIRIQKLPKKEEKWSGSISEKAFMLENGILKRRSDTGGEACSGRIRVAMRVFGRTMVLMGVAATSRITGAFMKGCG